MRKSSIVAWTIIVIIIIGIIVWVASEPSESPSDKTNQNEKNRSNFLEKLANRLGELQSEIASQMEALKLTVEMQQYLDRKLNQILIFIKTIIGLSLLSFVVLLTINGVEFWMALLTVSSFLCIGVPVLTFFFFKKIMDVRELVEWVLKKIREFVFKTRITILFTK